MAIQELLFQSLSDKEPARLELLQDLGEIAYQADPVGLFQDTQRSREREIPAQSYGPSDLFIDQEHICAELFRQQNGFSFARMQHDGKISRQGFPYRPNLKPGRK